MDWKDRAQAVDLGSNGWKGRANAVPPEEESTLRQMTRSAINTVLPIGGAIGAGVLAGPETMGLGSIPAGAAGYTAGSAAAKGVNHYLFGDETPESYENLAKETGKDFHNGLIFEMAGQSAPKAIEKTIEVASPVVKSAAAALADTAAVKSAKAMGASLADMSGDLISKAKRIGRYGLDNGLVDLFTDSQKAFEKASNLKQGAGESMSKVYGKVDDALGKSIETSQVKEAMQSKLAPEYESRLNSETTGLLKDIGEAADLRGENMSLAQAQSLKNEVGDIGFPNGEKPLNPTQRQSAAQGGSNVLRDFISDAAQKGAEATGDTGLLGQLNDAREEYELAKGAKKFLNKAAGKENMGTGRGIHWTLDIPDFLNSVGKKFGPNINGVMAKGANSLSGGLESLIDSAPQIGQMAAPIAGQMAAGSVPSKYLQAQQPPPPSQGQQILMKAEQSGVSPYDTEQILRKSDHMTPTEKALAIKQNASR